MSKFLFVILGPTGIGKTELSLNIAKILDTEIISSDSRQIYKELYIGTAAPSKDQLSRIKHHFVGRISIFDYYNASMFESEVNELLEELFREKQYVIMTGGSGLYINAVCDGIDEIPTVDPEIRKKLSDCFRNEGIESLRLQLKLLDPVYYSTVDLKNHKRILKALEICYMTGKTYSSFCTNSKKSRNFITIKIGLNLERDTLYDRINHRVDDMISAGLVEEAKILHKYKKVNALKTVGYKELFDHFEGKTSLNEAIELIKQNSRRYAKRQISWFSKDTEIKWFHPDQKKEILEYVEESLFNRN